MITKTKRIEKRFLYREILNKISTNTNGMVIQGMLIDDGVITYELVDEYKEVDVSLTLKDDFGTFPLVYEIIITTSDNFNDIGMINTLLNILNEIKELNKIWDRFYKSDKSRTNKLSTGLGLPIVRSILSQHNEDIWVKNIEGKGVSFIFTLKKSH